MCVYTLSKSEDKIQLDEGYQVYVCIWEGEQVKYIPSYSLHSAILERAENKNDFPYKQADLTLSNSGKGWKKNDFPDLQADITS